MAARIIDMFTRQPIQVQAQGRVADDNEQRAWFMEAARSGPENLSPEDQAEWIIMFHQFYLAKFLDACEGIAEAQEVGDLEHFMSVALAEMKKWPDF